MRRRLAFAALAPVAAAVTVATFALRTSGPQPLAAEATAPLTVLAKPFGWRAPGVPVSIVGFAGSGERVELLANGRPAASASAGTLGRYPPGFGPPRSRRSPPA